MNKQQSDYLSYLLRLWRESGGGNSRCCAAKAVWRASLQDGLTDRRLSFGSLEELFAFLRQLTRTASDAKTDEGDAKA